MTDKENDLLTGCLRGEKLAWDVFVLQYSSLVFHTIRKTFGFYHVEVGNDVVEDLFQEFFLALLRDDLKKLRQFKGRRGCSLASWLRVIAVRLTIDSLRSHQLSELESAEVFSAGLGLFDSVISGPDEEDYEWLAKALKTLSPRERFFVDLYYRQNLLPEEIATVLETSVSAIYTQKSRVLSKLRAALKNIHRQ
jgi:RNA polymerase sigma factor (sigma-70 family)